MATKKDIDFSLGKQTVIDELQIREEQMSQIAVSDAVQEKPPTQFVIFKLVDTKKRGRVHLDNVSDVLNPDTNKIERMRLLTGVASLWLKDQKDITPEYVRDNKPRLIFEDRFMRIAADDLNALEFVRKTNNCVDNRKRRPGGRNDYFEWNPQKQEEAALQKEMDEIEVMQLAMEQPMEKLLKHAQFLGVAFVNEMGERKTDSGIRTEYIIKAKKLPKLFKESLGSKEVEVNWMVKKAILDGKIDLGKQVGQAHFAAGGFISQIPPGKPALKYLVELALTESTEGRDFLNKLQKHTT